MEQYATTGVLQGKVITLENDDAIFDAAQSVEGRRVRVIVEPLLPAEEQDRRWREWAEKGPQGPIEDW